MAEPEDRSASVSLAGRRAAVVVAVGVSSALHIGKLPVAIPSLQAALGLGLVEAGFLLSVVQVAGMALGLFIGLVADRRGARSVMLAGLVALACGSVLGALASSVKVLLATRLLEGLGFLLAVLPAPALLRQCVREPATQARALGWWGAYMPLGTALALLLGSMLMGWVGWRGWWVALAALSVAAAGALWRMLPPDPEQTDAAPAPLWPRMRRTLVHRVPWLLALAFFCYSGQWLAVVGFLPTIYSQTGLSPQTVGFLSALAAGVNVVGNVAAGRLRAHGMAPGVLLSVGYLCMAAGAVGAFAAPGFPVLQYLAVLLFSSMGGMVPGTLFGLAVQLAPGRDTVSTTVGWMQQWSSFGQFIGPPLVAWLATYLGGWQGTWMVTASVSMVGLWLARQIQLTASRAARGAADR